MASSTSGHRPTDVTNGLQVASSPVQVQLSHLFLPLATTPALTAPPTPTPAPSLLSPRPPLTSPMSFPHPSTSPPPSSTIALGGVLVVVSFCPRSPSGRRAPRVSMVEGRGSSPRNPTPLTRRLHHRRFHHWRPALLRLPHCATRTAIASGRRRIEDSVGLGLLFTLRGSQLGFFSKKKSSVKFCSTLPRKQKLYSLDPKISVAIVSVPVKLYSL